MRRVVIAGAEVEWDPALVSHAGVDGTHYFAPVNQQPEDTMSAPLGDDWTNCGYLDDSD